MRRARFAALAVGLIVSVVVPAAGAGAGERVAAPARSTVQGQAVTIAANQPFDFPRLDCPTGQTSTGGGVTVSPEDGVFIQSSNPVGTSWQVSVRNHSDGPRTVTPVVVCTSDPSITHQIGNTVSGNTAISVATCPANQHAAGGGAVAAPLNYLSRSSPSDINWDARAKNTGSGPSSVTAFARCSDRVHSWKANDMGVVVPAAGVRSAHIECPAGEVPSAGGAIGDPMVLHNESFPTATGWTVRATNTDNVQHAIVAEVLCAAP